MDAWEFVGWAKRLRPPKLPQAKAEACPPWSGVVHCIMSIYRRAKVKGGVFFFTVVLADRSSSLLKEEIDHLRAAYRTVQHVARMSAAICGKQILLDAQTPDVAPLIRATIGSNC
jgi:hypothetical protein